LIPPLSSEGSAEGGSGGNITSITLIEYAPVRLYGKFRGKIYFLTEADQLRAAFLQERMGSSGKPMSADPLVAAVCLNRDEELLTMDGGFLSALEVAVWSREADESVPSNQLFGS